jgi:hypothetical protein
VIGLDQAATVYTPDGAGAFTVVAKLSLPCRLSIVGVDTVAAGDARAEAAGARRLLWGADYDMPTSAQVQVDGERWNVQPETVAAVRGPSGGVVYRRADAVRTI